MLTPRPSWSMCSDENDVTGHESVGRTLSVDLTISSDCYFWHDEDVILGLFDGWSSKAMVLLKKNHVFSHTMLGSWICSWACRIFLFWPQVVHISVKFHPWVIMDVMVDMNIWCGHYVWTWMLEMFYFQAWSSNLGPILWLLDFPWGFIWYWILFQVWQQYKGTAFCM